MPTSNTKYIDYLRDLRERYFRGEVSALIGAGFSKNIYPEFPNWDELLYDMIIELFKNEIQDELSKIKHLKKKRVQKKTFYKEEAKRIANRHGYLNIVSMYQEKHGYRECIEHYIETHIPYLEKDSNENLTIKDKIKNKSILLDESAFEIHTSLLNLTSLNHIYTTNYDNLLETISDKFSGKWKATTTSQELRLSQELKAIIKLHGNLRTNEREPFCFDNDHGKCYVISKEDYDTYPEKHEPFMQLMKISLLRETFILFGFSGTDPNFIAWVKWVRNILVRNPNIGQPNDEQQKKAKSKYRVFLFAIDDKTPTPAQNQFYENHNIAYIPILHPSITEYFDIEGSDDIKRKIALSKIISFFENKEESDQVQDITATNRYQQLWSNSFSITPKFNNRYYSEELILNPELINSLVKMSKINRFSSQIYKQKQLLEHQTQSWSTESRELVIKALQDTKYPPEYFRIDENIFRNNTDQKLSFDLIQQRFRILKSGTCKNPEINDNQSDESIYNLLLQSVFSFDFKTLKKRLNEWQPKDHWIQNKAMLKAIFDLASANNMLRIYLDKCSILHEKCYCTSLLRVLSFPADEYKTDEFEQKGISDLFDLSGLILKGITKEKNTKIKPYGLNQRTIFSSADNTKYLESIRFLQFLIDSGLPVYYRNLACIKEEEWFIVAKELYTEYPYPVLYYSLQVTSPDFQKRIGQEYAYSEKLKEVNKNILSILLENYLDETSPKYHDRLILNFTESLLTVVPAEIWESNFIHIYRQVIESLQLSLIIITANQFFYNGAELIKNDTNKIDLLKVTLDVLPTYKTDERTRSFFLSFAKKLTKKIGYRDELKSSLDNILQIGITDRDFMTIADLADLLSNDQINSILQSFFEECSNKDVSSLNIQVICSLIYKAKTNLLESKIKKIILNSPYLWSNESYIPINHIGQFINWNNEDLKSIYTQLETKYHQYLDKIDKDHIHFELNR
ncbi:MAG: SIR2 family protein, partial [Tannerellaceae bacterium]